MHQESPKGASVLRIFGKKININQKLIKWGHVKNLLPKSERIIRFFFFSFRLNIIKRHTTVLKSTVPNVTTKIGIPNSSHLVYVCVRVRLLTRINIHRVLETATFYSYSNFLQCNLLRAHNFVGKKFYATAIFIRNEILIFLKMSDFTKCQW